MRLNRSGTDVRLRFDPVEAQIMGVELDDLLVGLDEMGPGDPVWERLYPAAFTDAADAEEFREMVGEDLDNARRERIGACRAELAGATAGRKGPELSLGPESLDRWITALNDLRLALGTRLQITADDDGRLDPRDPQAQRRAVYQWLTGVQDGLVTAAMQSH
jgi:hypothetical protein